MSNGILPVVQKLGKYLQDTGFIDGLILHVD